ncbi:biopolymer transporter ExbD [Pedobacter sp. SYSU D00535]|uniref:ExbD/TolR family protein n=1 Tax=Pedobacter sp. SYSU D00535 TaxID=2810308 RepID=UPI001A967778|nr:biopolymer transporter ExbD [Pedobacter sp. SYSU D00535]
MAELNTQARSLRGRRRTQTIAARVDLTAMVDLMFLLITFFMLTSSLSKFHNMPLAMPDKAPGGSGFKIPDNRSMTICLGDNNKVLWYMGAVANPLAGPSTTHYSSSGIRKEITAKNKEAIQSSGSITKGLIVVVKPSDKSSYKNLVDILDELKIAGVNTYFIADLSAAEINQMRKKGIY